MVLVEYQAFVIPEESNVWKGQCLDLEQLICYYEQALGQKVILFLGVNLNNNH